MENMIVSSSPHIRSTTTTQSIMRDVIIALLPATVASVVLFGWRALVTILVCVGTAVLSEFLFNIITKKEQTVGDLSSIITGLLLALSIPAKASIWHCIVGAVVAIVVVKCMFGGLGCNFANPAVTARVFLLIAFSSAIGGGTSTVIGGAELVATATPLEIIKLNTGAELPTLLDMFLGNRAGAIGETCALALIVGGIYLIVRRVIKWQVPVIYIGIVFLFSLILTQSLTAALYQVLGGGLIIAAFFMITDYVTTPINALGKMVFAFGCGIITVLIRFWGSYPEGVSYAVLIMNVLSPYIEKMCTKKPFGKVGK